MKISMLILLVCLAALAQGARAEVFDFSQAEVTNLTGIVTKDGDFALAPGGPAAPGDRCLQFQGLGKGKPCVVEAPFQRLLAGVLSLKVKLDRRTSLQFYLKGSAAPFRISLRDGEPLRCAAPEGERTLFPDEKLTSGRWYHLQIFFDCAAGKYALMLDDRLYAEGLPFAEPTGYVDVFRLYTFNRAAQHRAWLDDLAIGSRDDLLLRPAIYAPERKADWTEMPLYRGFHLMQVKSEPSPALHDGEFRLAHDATNLYLRFTVTPGTDKNSLELFVQPARSGTIYQWIVILNGEAKQYEDGKPATLNPGVKVSREEKEGRVILELAVPWQALGRTARPSPDEEWGLSVCYNDTAPTTWAFLDGAKGYRAPEFFPRAYFSAAPKPVLWGVGPFRRATRTELIENPELNRGYAGVAAGGWTTNENTQWVETRQLTGDYALQRESEGLLASQTIDLPFPGGGEYKLNAKLLARQGGVVQLRIGYLDASGASGWLTLVETNEAAYGIFSRKFQFPEGARRVTQLEARQTTKSGQTGIAQASISGARVSLQVYEEGEALRSENMRPVGEAPVTPHIPWARPLAGGPIKALFILTGRGIDAKGSYNNYAEERIPVELAQRIELDYDVITPWEGRLLSYTADRIGRRLAGNEYEVMIVSLPPSQQDYWEAIADRVRAGIGLVTTVELPDGATLEARSVAFGKGATNHPLTSGLPLALLPSGYLRRVETMTWGAGRTVALNLHITRGYGLTPEPVNPYEIYRQTTWPYWEAYYALMSRAIYWAARGETPTGQIARVERDHRDSFWQPIKGDQTERPVGAHFFVERALDKNDRVVSWALRTVESGRAERLELGTKPLPQLDPDAEVKVAGNVAGITKGQTYRVRYALRDHRDRILAEGEQPLPAAATNFNITCRPRGVIGHEAILTAELLDKDGLIARARTYVPFRMNVAEQLDDYTFDFLVTTAPFPQHVVPTLTGMLRDELGANCFLTPGHTGLNGMQIPLEGDLLTEFWGYQTKGSNRGYKAGIFRDSPRIEGHTRIPCLNNPKTIEIIDTAFRNFTEDMAIVNPAILTIDDESALVLSSPILDLCDSPHCRAAYALWLEKQFGSVAAMNAAWGTAYRAFGEPSLVTWKEARERKNPAEFVTFRRFMDNTFTERSAQVRRVVQARLPACRVGYENTRAMRWYSGWDLDAMALTLDLFGTYGTDLGPHTSGRYVQERELICSLAPGSKQMGWFGYGGALGGNPAYAPWYWALHGASGVSLYYFGFPSHSYLLGDLRRTHDWEKIRTEMAPLCQGLGRLLHRLQRTPPGIAMLFTQESLAASWAQSTTTDKNDGSPAEPQGAFLGGTEHARRMLEDGGYQFEFLTPRLIETNRLAGYRVLIVPSVPAVPASVREKITGFVKAGGTVIAFPNTASTDGWGTPTSDDWLRELFGISRATTRFPRYQARNVAWEGTNLNLFGYDEIKAETSNTERAFADGKPALTLREHGKGRALYANFILPMYQPETTEFKQLAAWLYKEFGRQDIAPWATVTRSDGSPVSGIERVQYSNGPVKVLGLIQDYRFPESVGEMILTLPQEAIAIDLRTGGKVGKGARLPIRISLGEVKVLGLLPADAPPPAGSARTDAVAPGELVEIQIQGLPAPISIVRAEVTGPDGRRHPHYDANVPLADGQGILRIPTALDDPTGDWRIKLHEILTGREAEMKFNLRP